MSRVTLAACAVLLLLTGCAGDYYQIAEPQPKTVVTVLFGQSNSDPGLEDMLVDKINQEYPGVTLEWESVDWGEYFSSEMQAKIASGEVPDLMIGKAQDVAAYRLSGYLAEFDASAYTDIRGEALDSVTVDGKVYGLPYNAFYQGVLYNKNIFWRYGLEPPNTLAEMDAVIARLTEVGVTPFATHFQDNWFVGNASMQFAVNQVFQKHPHWGDAFRAGRQSFVASPEYAACFMQIKTLYDNTWPDAFHVNQSECSKRFANEEAAMFLTGSWAVQTLFALRPNMEVGIFPYPNAEGTAKLLFEPNLTFMKNARSENGEIVDGMIRAIFADKELSITTCAFTQTTSMIKGVEPDSIRQIDSDITAYNNLGNVIDVTIGNRQLVWAFQDSCARQICGWLKGETTFDEVLRFADDNRTDSGGF